MPDEGWSRWARYYEILLLLLLAAQDLRLLEANNSLKIIALLLPISLVPTTPDRFPSSRNLVVGAKRKESIAQRIKKSDVEGESRSVSLESDRLARRPNECCTGTVGSVRALLGFLCWERALIISRSFSARKRADGCRRLDSRMGV
ncbi:hypothetical protein Mapa_010401 [Marchantia paleacea]|nr:hypothetical protein Mapa_010401 [Marchantia paleacea]